MLLVFVFLFNGQAQALHILGGFMDYKMVGSTANIRLVIYRDCGVGGAQFDNPASIAIYRQNGQSTVLFQEKTVNHNAIRRLDSLTVAGCIPAPPKAPCVEITEYIFNFDIPASDDSSTYVVVYQRCCRNSTISNLINPRDIGSTFSVAITAGARKEKNQSPQITIAVPMIVCLGQQINLDLSARDAEGDLLLYSLCAPDAGGGNIAAAPASTSCNGLMPTPPCPPPFDEVPFTAPAYSPLNPLPAPGMSLSPINGTLSFTPNKAGLFTYGVCIEEYRNGLIISNIKRELSLWIVDGTLSAQNLAKPQQLSIMPNPASNQAILDMRLFEGLQGRITVSDFSGRQVLVLNKRFEAQETLDLSELASGTFVISVHTEKGTARGKFVHN